MASALQKVIIHTDGGCWGNPGIGGWAAVLEAGGNRKEVSGGELATTNNRMELTAALEALKVLNKPCEVEMHTDSQYVRNGITKWVLGWKKNGWKTAAKQPVKNADLWRALDAATQLHTMTWKWVKGHAGVVDNERCDVLANEVMAGIKQRHSRAELDHAMMRFKAQESSTVGAEALL